MGAPMSHQKTDGVERQDRDKSQQDSAVERDSSKSDVKIASLPVNIQEQDSITPEDVVRTPGPLYMTWWNRLSNLPRLQYMIINLIPVLQME